MLKTVFGFLLSIYGLIDLTIGFTGLTWLPWICLGAGLVMSGKVLMLGAFRFVGFVFLVWIAILLLSMLGFISL